MNNAPVVTTATSTTLYNWFCPSDQPLGSLPSGGGQLCYDTLSNCADGPNSCDSTKPCAVDYQACPTGIAGSAGGHSIMCQNDYPEGALPNGFGTWCVMAPFTTSRLIRGCRRSRLHVHLLAQQRCSLTSATQLPLHGSKCQRLLLFI